MGKIKYKVFISYRGNSKRGQLFAKSLYDAMLKTPDSKRIFGNVYYSPSEPVGNFRDDIEEVMKDVDYFIIPFDDKYFDDFLTKGGSLNKDSITRLEIDAAIKCKCKFFLPVSLDGSDFDSIRLKAMFTKHTKHTKLSCAKRLFYIDENLEESKAIDELVYQVCEAIYSYQKRRGEIEDGKSKKNICMRFKQEAEASIDSLNVIGCKKITFVNFAGTSFVAGNNIATTYDNHDWFKNWFFHAIKTREISATVVLTNPYSEAAIDAEKYKMGARGLRTPIEKVIKQNLETLLETKAIYSDAKIRIYLTDIVLPYSTMLVEFDDHRNNYAKIDLYSALLTSDDQRPTFSVGLKKSTREMYHFFKDNSDTIIKNSKELKIRSYEKYWLYNEIIAHRANINNKFEPMTEAAFIQCITRKIPIEVDVTRLADDGLWIGRDADIEFEGKRKISELSIEQFKKYRDSISETVGKFLLLNEFLELIDGRIPILFELKHEMNSITDEKINTSCNMASVFCEKIRGYEEKYEGEFAICSSNPYVMSKAKDLGIKAKCGQITLDISSYDVGKDIIKLHENNEFMEEYRPDFISCKIEDINKKLMLSFCNKEGIPLLGWVADTDEKKELGKCCTNIIAENFMN